MLAPLFLEVKMKLTEFHYGALVMYTILGVFSIVGHSLLPKDFFELLMGLTIIVSTYLVAEGLRKK